MAVIYYKKHPTFSVRMSTTMIRPFYWLVGLLTLGGWPDRPGAVRLIDRLDKRGSRGLLGLLLQIMIYYWYIQGIKEGAIEFRDLWVARGGTVSIEPLKTWPARDRECAQKCWHPPTTLIDYLQELSEGSVKRKATSSSLGIPMREDSPHITVAMRLHGKGEIT